MPTDLAHSTTSFRYPVPEFTFITVISHVFIYLLYMSLTYLNIERGMVNMQTTIQTMCSMDPRYNDHNSK